MKHIITLGILSAIGVLLISTVALAEDDISRLCKLQDNRIRFLGNTYSTRYNRCAWYGPGLYKADLSGAKLMSYNLSGASMKKANLSGANLSRANLNFANLSKADLREADLSGADLRTADLSEAKNLSSIICDEDTDFPGSDFNFKKKHGITCEGDKEE